jgi:hypothetical protein
MRSARALVVVFIAMMSAVTFPALDYATAQVQLPQMPQIPENGALVPPATPVIVAPRPGATLAPPITVKGTTSGRAKVTVTATLQLRVPLTAIDSRLAETTTNADAKGNWQVSLSYTIPVRVTGAEVVIKAVAANPVTGQKSAEAQVVIKPRR